MGCRWPGCDDGGQRGLPVKVVEDSTLSWLFFFALPSTWRRFDESRKCNFFSSPSPGSGLVEEKKD
jgi:hypothetical protein